MPYAPELWLHLLDRLPGGGLVAHVRFPAGWERPATVRCSAAETFVVLDGELLLGGRQFSAGTLVHVPASAPRAGTTAPGGCTAVAWFDGPARWSPVADGPAGGPAAVSTSVGELPDGATVVLEGRRWTVHRRSGPAAADGELLDLGTGAWRRVRVGEPVPGPDRPHLLAHAGDRPIG